MCVARLEVLDSIAADNAERLRVIVVVKENNIERTANLAKVKYSVALDSEMKIFKWLSAYVSCRAA